MSKEALPLSAAEVDDAKADEGVRMPEHEMRPQPNFEHEEKGGYPGGPKPPGKPPIPPLFKPVTRLPEDLQWPAGGLLERRAIFVYEVARQQAQAVNAPIIPEAWSARDVAFRSQFLNVIEMMCGPSRKSNPEDLHNDWWRKYEEMGWVYGPQRDPVAKTHPDMVPFSELGWEERNKDAVFVALCEIARQWIIDEPVDEPDQAVTFNNFNIQPY